MIVAKGYEKINKTQDSATVATSDIKKRIFMSTANIGFQLEAISKIDEAAETLDLLNDIIHTNELRSSFGSKLRIGTKLTHLYSPKGEDFSKVKRKFREKIMKGYQDAEDVLGITIGDYAFEAFFASYKNRMLHLTMGPVTIEEAIERFFNEKTLYEDSYAAKNGYLAQLDLYVQELEAGNLDEIKQAIEENFTYLEELRLNFEGVFSDAD